MKVLIFGGNGFVGGRLLVAGQRLGYDCAIADVAESCNVPNVNYFRCDITNQENVDQLFAAYRPTLAVNVAALADIDRAEKEQEVAYAINVTGAGNCAKSATKYGCKYVWFSSDAVFSGNNRAGYEEQSPLAPVNYYGETKLLGEAAVAVSNPHAIILRISLVLGFPVHTGNSFLAGLAAALEAGKQVNATTREVRTPIDVLTLCDAIYELAALDYSGGIHLGSTGSINRFELTKLAAKQLCGSDAAVHPVFETDAARAPRHEHGIISVKHAQSILKKTSLCDVRETIVRACSTCDASI